MEDPAITANVVTLPVESTTFLSMPFPESATMAKSISDEITTCPGLLNDALVPIPLTDPDAPVVFPATNAEVTGVLVREIRLIRFPV